MVIEQHINQNEYYCCGLDRRKLKATRDVAGNVSYNFGQHATKELLATLAKSYNDDEISDINSSSFKITTPMPNFERIFLPLLLPNQIC